MTGLNGLLKQMNSGLGLIPISFDWTQVTYAGQPLTTPFYITANVRCTSADDE